MKSIKWTSCSSIQCSSWGWDSALGSLLDLPTVVEASRRVCRKLGSSVVARVSCPWPAFLGCYLEPAFKQVTQGRAEPEEVNVLACFCPSLIRSTLGSWIPVILVLVVLRQEDYSKFELAETHWSIAHP